MFYALPACLPALRRAARAVAPISLHYYDEMQDKNSERLSAAFVPELIFSGADRKVAHSPYHMRLAPVITGAH